MKDLKGLTQKEEVQTHAAEMTASRAPDVMTDASSYAIARSMAIVSFLHQHGVALIILACVQETLEHALFPPAFEVAYDFTQATSIALALR